MGQFYTATDVPVIDDKMYQLPFEMMAKVIERKDKAVNTTIDAALKLEDFDVVHHAIDTEQARQVKSAWDQKINGLVDKIRTNPADYMRYQGQITSLSRDLQKDISFGDINALAVRKANIDAWDKDQDALYKKDPEKYHHKDALTKEQYAKNALYKDPTTGAYNYFTGEDLLGTDPMSKIADEAVKGAMGKDWENIRVTDNGEWEVKKAGKWEGFDDKRLVGMMRDYIMSNPAIAQAYAQKERLGAADFEKEYQTGLSYLKEKYGVRKVSNTDESRMGDIAKKRAMDALDKAKEEENKPIINQETSVDNITVDQPTFYGNIKNAKTSTEISKKNLVDIWNSYYRNDSTKQMNSSTLPTIGELEKKMQQLSILTGVNYNNEIAAAKAAATRQAVYDASYNTYQNWKRDLNNVRGLGNVAPGTPGDKAAFDKWSAQVNKSKGDKNVNKYGSVSTYQGMGISNEAEKAVKNTYKEQALYSPFSTRDFNLTIKQGDKDVTILFPSSATDPTYVKYKGMIDAARAKAKAAGKPLPPADTFVARDGKTYKFHNQFLATITPVQLAQAGYIQAKQPATTGGTGLSLDAGASAGTPEYFVAGTNKPVQFFPETYMPSSSVDNSNRNYFTANVRFGDDTKTVNYIADHKGVVTNEVVNRAFDSTRDGAVLVRELNAASGSSNLSGSVKIPVKDKGGNTHYEEVTLDNGVLRIERSSRNGVITVAPGNTGYADMLSAWTQEYLRSK